MEIFGNPITGYTSNYYSMLIENQKEINDNQLEAKVNEGHKGSQNILSKDDSIKYNRMQHK